MAKSKKAEIAQTDNATLVTDAIVLSSDSVEIPQQINRPVCEMVDENNVFSSASLVKNGITYPSPSSLMQPIIERLNGASQIRAVGTHELEMFDNGNQHKAFQRFNVIAKFPVDDEIFYEIGCLVALDLQQPKIKIYSGAVVSACLNLSVFGADTVAKFDLTSNSAIDTVDAILQSMSAKIENAKRVISQLKSVELSADVTERFIGALSIGNANTRNTFGANYLSKGIDLVGDANSKFYYKNAGFNAWTFYNAFTENIKQAQIFDVADKSRDFYKLVIENTTMLPSAN